MPRNSFAPNPLRAEPLPARTKWDRRYAQYSPTERLTANPLLTRWLPRLPRQGRALDVAAGAGRHSLALARHGLQVHAVDISWRGLRLLAQRMEPGFPVAPVALDLQRGWLPATHYEVIVNFLFLERAIWPAIANRLARGGWLIVETFTVEQLTRPAKRHIRRDFLLEAGELREAFGFLEILHYHEGWHSSGATAQLVGRVK
ncbi:MAG: class I SAM-dependent methyltransferase [Anaerolineae bacterium]